MVQFNMEAIPQSDIKSDVTFDISIKRTTWIGHMEVRQTPKKQQLKNGHFQTIYIWPFFANYMFVFYKTEIQTIILRCLISLNLNWYKSYDKKHKNAKNPNVWFCKKQTCSWQKMARYGQKMTIYQLLFFGSQPNLHGASGYMLDHNF